MEQQFALPPWAVIGPGAIGVLGDVHALEPEFVAVEAGPAIDQRRPSHPQSLDLGAHEDESGLEGVLNEVVVPGLPVARDELSSLFFGHAQP